jgi:hypothetical protein
MQGVMGALGKRFVDEKTRLMARLLRCVAATRGNPGLCQKARAKPAAAKKYFPVDEPFDPVKRGLAGRAACWK